MRDDKKHIKSQLSEDQKAEILFDALPIPFFKNGELIVDVRKNIGKYLALATSPRNKSRITMINHTELRIGNIVEPITKGPCAVTGITTQKVKDGDFVLVYAEGEGFIPECIYPVGISEKYLIELGFIHKPLGDYPDMMILRKESFTFKYHSGHLSICKFDNCVSHKVEYVHHLQNIIFDLK